MVLSDHLKDLVILQGENAIFQRTWIIRLCSKFLPGDIDLPWRDRKNLLGFSSPFKLPGRNLSFAILKTGIADHAVMTCVATSMSDFMKRITERLSRLSDQGKSIDEMLAEISDLDDQFSEFPEDFMILNVGEDLKMSTTYLRRGSQTTIDTFRIEI